MEHTPTLNDLDHVWQQHKGWLPHPFIQIPNRNGQLAYWYCPRCGRRGTV